MVLGNQSFVRGDRLALTIDNDKLGFGRPLNNGAHKELRGLHAGLSRMITISFPKRASLFSWEET